jgi:ubiquitin carboxyl-terminal hydrolase 36/42
MYVERYISNALPKNLPHVCNMKSIFGGFINNTIECLKCGCESHKFEDFISLSIDVAQSSLLKISLYQHFKVKLLEGKNKYHCDACKALSNACKEVSILQEP